MVTPAFRIAEEYELRPPPPSTTAPSENNPIFTSALSPSQPEKYATSYSHDPVPTFASRRVRRSWKFWEETTTLQAVDKQGPQPVTMLSRSPKQLVMLYLVIWIPVFITAALAQLNFRSVFWFDVENNATNQINISHWSIGLNEFLTVLQFLAKIHEILMIGSLSAIILHFVRWFLVGPKGLPFGLLTAGYSVGSAEYIFSKTFWRSGFTRTFWLFSLLFVFVRLLANLLGPSSAIAMIPNLD